jgi:hypothetical protein
MRNFKIILFAYLLLSLISPFFSYAEFNDIERVSVSSAGIEGNAASNSKVSISNDGRYVVFDSDATNLVAGDTNTRTDVFVYDRNTDTIERVSVDSNGVEGNNTSNYPSISVDGRYVVFISNATNLVDNDTNNVADVFVHDRNTNVTERVSLSNAGVEGNGHSGSNSSTAYISSDGRYVGFLSDASNLVASDSNGMRDVFVYDRDTDTIERVNVTNLGAQTNGSTWSLSMAADGIHVAFASAATNLVAGDSNAKDDVFVYNRNTDTVERVSLDSNGVQGNDHSYGPSISDDGRYVAFYSDATNLIGSDANGVTDTFVYDRNTDTTERVSVDSNGIEANGVSYAPAISPDGRFVAIDSDATNLVAGDTNGTEDIFVYDRDTNVTERASLDEDGEQASGYSYYPDIAEDGLFVAFVSDGAGLVSGDTNAAVDAFVVSLSYVSAPILSVTSPTNLSYSSAILIGNITDDGGENNTERGFEFGLTASYGNEVSQTGSFSTGEFSLEASGLDCNTLYHFRSFSTNSEDTGVSSDSNFTTESCPSSSGSTSRPRTIVTQPSGTEPSSIRTFPTDCLPTYNYSPSTGIKCPTTTTTDNSVPECVISTTLKLGSRGEEVKCLQTILNILSDGIFGPITKSSVINFQKSNNLVPDGIVGPITRGVLYLN